MSPTVQREDQFGPFLQGLIYALIASGGLFVAAWLGGEPLHNGYIVLASMVFVMCLAAFRRYDMLRRWEFGRVGSIGSRMLFAWMLIAALLVLVGFATRHIDAFERWVLLGWLAGTPVAFAAAHVFARYGLLRLFPNLARSRTAVIVFVNPSSRKLAAMMDGLETPRFKFLGFFEDREPERMGLSDSNIPILGGTDALVDYVNTNSVEVVFVVLPAHGADRALGVVEQLGDTTASIYYVPDFRMFDLTMMRFTEVGGLPVLTLSETPFFGADGMLKRIMDVLFSAAILVLLAPIFLFIAVVILVTMGWPIFFTQRRYGLDGKEIKVHKFRSMRVLEDGESVNQATRDDPRVTPVGRFIRRTSIDELPQFWNVLKGQMSVVGPRPHAVSHNEMYRKLVKRYMARHKVKPGMTGWAQVHGLRGETRDIEDMKRRVQYDLDYIQRWSPELDVRIVLKTLYIIFRDHEAY